MYYIKCTSLKRKASTKRGQLIAKAHNTEEKWSVKPCIVRTNFSEVLRQKLVEWIMKNPNVHEFPISRDNLLIKDVESGIKHRFLKLLLDCYMPQFHNKFINSRFTAHS